MPSYISALPSPRFAATWPRRVSVLGATGSIGRSALAVMEEQPGRYQVAALAGGRNVELLAAQSLRWRPPVLAVLDGQRAELLRSLLTGAPGYKPEILTGRAGYAAAAALPEADLTLCAQAGAAGLDAACAAARAGKVLALANKEALILAGDMIRKECARSGAVVLPVDSEHNAVLQCLLGQDCLGAGGGSEEGAGDRPGQTLRRIILTASGGPFLGRSARELAKVTPEQALAHPTWSMGAKISIDSATLMNKGMELVEACRLFGLPPEQVDILIHPQSVVHSLVEFSDASLLAQLGAPDMRLPIAFCLGWPLRLPSGAARLDLAASPPLSFSAPDEAVFPSIAYWREALREGRGLDVALNAADETAVALFLRRDLAFTDIFRLTRMVMDAWKESAGPGDPEEALGMDAAARRLATELAARL